MLQAETSLVRVPIGSFDFFNLARATQEIHYVSATSPTGQCYL
jgi:hypothetical protein